MTHDLKEWSSHQSKSSVGPLVIALLGFVFLVMNIVSFGRSWLLNHGGVVTQGTVIAMHGYHRRGGTFYQADYSFTANGRLMKDTGDIAVQRYLALRPGDAITVRYVPSIPTISETADMSHYSTTVFITAFLGFPASLFILFIAYRAKRMPNVERSTPDDIIEEAPSAPVMTLVTGIAFTVYPVVNMRRARTFYESALGLRAARDLQGEWVEYHLWGSCFALSTMKAGGDGGAMIAFEVSHLENFVEKLRAEGAPIKTEPFSTPGCRMAVVLDPEGNALMLHSRRSAIKT